MKKVFTVIILAFVVFLYASPGYAEKITEVKPSKALVGFRYHNTSLWGMTTRQVKEEIIDKNIAPMLAKYSCEMITDEKYLEKLQSKGYSDFASAEKADLLDIYKDDGFRYLIFVDVEPLRKAVPFGFESAAFVKIIDIQTAKYIHCGKIYKVTKWGGGGTVLWKIGQDIAAILEEKAFLAKSP